MLEPFCVQNLHFFENIILNKEKLFISKFGFLLK